MARIRSIKIGFFTNEELCALSPWHRLLFAGLWVIADKAGRLEDRPKRIKAELFPYDPIDVDHLLNELAAAGFVVRYAVKTDRYIAIPTFLEHQHPHYREVESTLPEPGKQRPKTRQSSTNHDAMVAPDDRIDLGTLERDGGTSPVGSGLLSLGSGSGHGSGSGSGHGDARDDGRLVADGVAWNPNGKLARSSLVGDHRRCFACTVAACGRGICVPAFLVGQWRQQVNADDPIAADERIRQFVQVEVARVPDGPIGDDPLKFWRAAWQAAHGSRAPETARSNSTTAHTMRAARAVLES